jgi:hypothetical protein
MSWTDGRIARLWWLTEIDGNRQHALSRHGLVHQGVVESVLRGEGHVIDDTALAQTTPPMRRHLNRFGRYDFDLEPMR